MSNQLPEPLKLADRLLWLDGSISVAPENLSDILMRTSGTTDVYVTHLTPEVEELNAMLLNPIIVKKEIDYNRLSFEWDLPDAYKYLDLDEYLVGLSGKIEVDNLYEKRVKRLHQEIAVYKSANLYPVLLALVFVIDELRRQNVVWGVGRGSSCSSYLLYLLGLHEVDAVKYDINLSDFLHD